MKASNFIKYIQKINDDDLLKENEENVKVFTKDGAEFVITDINISIVDNKLKLEISPVSFNMPLKKVAQTEVLYKK